MYQYCTRSRSRHPMGERSICQVQSCGQPSRSGHREQLVNRSCGTPEREVTAAWIASTSTAAYCSVSGHITTRLPRYRTYARTTARLRKARPMPAATATTRYRVSRVNTYLLKRSSTAVIMACTSCLLALHEHDQLLGYAIRSG